MKTLRTKQEGFVIIVVLCMVVMLSVLLLAFNQESRANLQNVEDFRKSAQALNCARAGLNIAIAVAKESSDVHFGKSLDFFSGENAIKLDRGQCTITVTQESGKINVNHLKEDNGKLNRIRIEHFLRLIDIVNLDGAGDFRIDYSIVPSIIDWIDVDDEVTTLPFIKHRNQGAESGYYNRLNAAYGCRNAPVDTVEELVGVRGMSPEVFERLRDCLTVCGDGKINVNSASVFVLASLSEQMDATLAKVIIERRTLKPFESVSELRDIPGMTDGLYYDIRRMLTVKPTDRYYNVTSRGDVDRLSRTVTAIIRINDETRGVETVLYRELM
ncbi:MAG: general secretion pathway protein GspK [Phycisphaerales bacterium]|nr:MAG: general secretion pathway protein GspK [Phycisphaerales bacterium]